jgi:hypothetical protein
MLAIAYVTGRASHARQIKGEDPDKKGYPGPPAWGLGMRLTTSTKKNKKSVTKPLKKKRDQGPPRAVELMIMIILCLSFRAS